jgi:GH24 family phage-related lysozyme (muramidase)
MDPHADPDDDNPNISNAHRYLFAADNPVNVGDESGLEGEDISIGLSVSNTVNSISATIQPTFLQTFTVRGASNLSSRGLHFLEIEEGFEQFPYDTDKSKKPHSGNCTIGYGFKLHNGPCNEADYAAWPKGITKIAAEDKVFDKLFSQTLPGIADLVEVPLAQREFDTLVDFTYNTGPGYEGGDTGLASTKFLPVLNMGGYFAVPPLLLTSKTFGNQGLINRRTDEVRLWTTGVYIAHGRYISF